MTLNWKNNSAAVTVDELWLSTLRASGRSPKTLEIYQYALTQLSTWRGDDGITTVSRIEALNFVQHLNATYKPSGVVSRLKAIKAFFNWAIVEELVPGPSPFARITVTIPEDPQPTASSDQVEAMLAKARKSRNHRRDVALLTLLIDSGARKGEISALTVADVDLRSGVITIRQSKSMPRTVALSDRSVLALARWMRQRGVGGGSLWSVANPYLLVRQVVKRHSDGTLTAHQLRRRLAVEWLRKGGSESGLMRHCGWHSPTMIGHYSKACASELAQDEYRRLMSS